VTRSIVILGFFNCQKRGDYMVICVIGLGSMGKRRIKLLKAFFDDLVIIGIDNNVERVKKCSG